MHCEPSRRLFFCSGRRRGNEVKQTHRRNISMPSTPKFGRIGEDCNLRCRRGTNENEKSEKRGNSAMCLDDTIREK
eukprot:3318505-Rhodomonas_salina.1